MKIKTVLEELKKITQALQSCNAMDWNFRENTQRNINFAYDVAYALKKRIEEEYK